MADEQSYNSSFWNLLHDITIIFPALLHALVRFIHANVPPVRRRWSSERIPDLTGRVAIVTGGTAGIGFFTCLELARRGAKVYLASRTPSRAQAAIQRIIQLVPTAQIEFIYFDLTVLSSAKAAADSFTKKETRLDILINNAGSFGIPYKLSPDGIEIQACNATGHFALTKHLLPILKETASGILNTNVRIVNVASMAHIIATRPDLSTLEGLNRRGDCALTRYNYSKLNNVLFTNELQRRLSETSIHCVSVHPGVVATELSRDIVEHYNIWGTVFKFFEGMLATPRDGAITQLYAATSPDIDRKGLRASYLVPYGQVGKKTCVAEDKDGKLGRQFWLLAESLMKAAEDKHK